MHKFLTLASPHIFLLLLLYALPSQYALYVMVTLYLLGIYLNHKKDKQHQEQLDSKEASLKFSGNWWEVLGTERNASVSECARVRKLLTKIYHPDGGQAPNETQMRRINEAFEARAEQPETSVPYGHFTH